MNLYKITLFQTHPIHKGLALDTVNIRDRLALKYSMHITSVPFLNIVCAILNKLQMAKNVNVTKVEFKANSNA